MYGTIAKLKTKKGVLDEIRKMETGRRPAGFLGSYVFNSDQDPEEMWLVAIFESKSSYISNANSPEQDKEFRSLMQFLKADPEWHDGEIVFAMNPH
jgi:hypothetical protein